MKNKKIIKEQEELLDQVEVGEEGALFFSEGKVEYSLKEILNHAFTLFYYHLLNSFGDVVDLSSEKSMERLKKAFVREAQLPFSKILCYTNNARRVLKEMNHYDDEEAVDIDFDVIAYRSPKDNYVIDFKEFINVQDNGEEYITTLSTEVLHETYGADNFFVIDLNPGNAFGIEDIKLVDLESLTNREIEAFYGRHAQEVLGWIPTDLKDRNKNKLFIKIK